MQIREVGVGDLDSPLDTSPSTALDTLLETVLDIRLAFLTEFHDRDPDSWDTSFVDATRTYLRTGIHAGSVRCWIAADDDDVLGGVSVPLFDKHGWSTGSTVGAVLCAPRPCAPETAPTTEGDP